MPDPNLIAVDLTPVLPGGENGGAKVFVLELVRRLAAAHPATRFLLLTQGTSHDELSALDAPNVERLLVVGATPARRRVMTLAKGLLRRGASVAPRRLAMAVARVASRLARRRPPGPSLRDRGVDLLFCPFTAPVYREAGLPVVCTIYDLQYRAYPQFFRPEDVAHRDQAFLAAARHASVLVAISDFARRSAGEAGRIEGHRLRTIYLRMALRIQGAGTADAEATLRSLGLARDAYLLYPANFWRHKNHEMLLTAFGIAAHGGLARERVLVCTGAPGERMTWLRQAAAALGLGDRIRFPGYVTDEQLGHLLANARGLVFPSLYEGFGLPLVEAMAAGVPVACSDVTSLPEVSGDAALLFDPRVPGDIAKALLRLDADDALRARLKEAGRRRAAEFADSVRMADEYWSAFSDALSGARVENCVVGVYADGWAGRRLDVEVAPAPSSRRLQLEFSAPDWLPARTVNVVARDPGRGTGDIRVAVPAGESRVLEVPLVAGGACIRIDLAPVFVPRRAGIGEDARELSLQLRRCSVAGPEAGVEMLYPEAEPR
ncbi:MAG TPA: glycosyltransferase family 1 protein [Burkholderiaceae bacterium]|nr:glycosyltransferase family 1 protein [Burkholderiaceae bacterium]